MSLDVQPAPMPHDTFYCDVISGLRKSQPTIPAKYLYDDEGSRLFNQICQVPEYYPTRVEMMLTNRYASDISALIGSRTRLVELGAGSGLKTKILLNKLHNLSAYIPVDISPQELDRCVANLSKQFPTIDIQPICVDYTAEWSLPRDGFEGRTTIYFPGSTIGNFHPERAQRFLRQLCNLAGPRGALLIGVDLQKERSILEAAYNDTAGVTADFNLNLLRRINRECNADFDLNQFRHLAIYNQDQSRIEMRLFSTQDQAVSFPTETFDFREGDSIVTEHSYKYSIESFAALSEAANWRIRSIWSDDNQRFSMWLLETRSYH